MPEAMEIIRKINAGENNAEKKTIYSEYYDFYVSTDEILLIENGRYHSLTFPVFRFSGKEGITENLVLSEEDDGSYSVSLYEYKLSDRNKEDLINGKATIITEQITSEELPQFNSDLLVSRMECTTITRQVFVNCSEDAHGNWNVDVWHECEADVKPKMFTISRVECIEIEPEYLSGENSNGNGSNNGGGSGTGNSGTYNPTIPAFDPEKDFDLVKGHITNPIGVRPTKEQRFFNGLSQMQKAIMQSLPLDVRNDLLNI